ncbi:MAG: Transcriptional regulator, AcrR family, partial [uncultured Acetobacteraceae bacterium]
GQRRGRPAEGGRTHPDRGEGPVLPARHPRHRRRGGLPRRGGHQDESLPRLPEQGRPRRRRPVRGRCGLRRLVRGGDRACADARGEAARGGRGVRDEAGKPGVPRLPAPPGAGGVPRSGAPDAPLGGGAQDPDARGPRGLGEGSRRRAARTAGRRPGHPHRRRLVHRALHGRRQGGRGAPPDRRDDLPGRLAV